MRNLALPLVLLLSFVACDQQPVAPPAEALAKADNPKANIQILRFQDHFAAAWGGFEESGLRAIHTTFPIPESDDPFIPETNCGPQADLDKIDFKRVGQENLVDFFASDFHMKANGRVWIIVRDRHQAGDCYGVKLIAEGWGTIKYNDNDWLGVAPGEKATNAWSFKATGTLTTPGGRQVRYEGDARYTVKQVILDEDGNPVPIFSRIREDVKLY
jgi:hypothetical protein